MYYSEEHLYSIALRKCSLIGDINFFKLINTFKSSKEVWNHAKREYSKIDSIGRKTVSDIGNPEHLKFAEKEMEFCERNNIQINLRHLGDLPFLLNECDDAPAILYQKGNFDNTLTPLSLVGTRNITLYGKKFIEDFFQESRSLNYASISGLALGVDKEVHEKSIENKIPTVGVLAHGLHTLYPSKNRKLSDRIIENGGTLFTEFNSSQKPDRKNFIQRNRIIAGISPATIVVETAFGGGSISTASFANSYNRDVYALPGKITDIYSQGCNQLIFQNKAIAISTIKNLIDSLGFGKPKSKTEELFPICEPINHLTENQRLIYRVISAHPQINLDELIEKTSLPSHKILPLILELELLSKIRSLSGRQFMIV